MPYTPIVATLGYVLSPDGRQALMIHRNARPGDLHLGKYNGLGGKVERDEDVASGMRREILEEAGIVCGTMRMRGTHFSMVRGFHLADFFTLGNAACGVGAVFLLAMLYMASGDPRHFFLARRAGAGRLHRSTCSMAASPAPATRTRRSGANSTRSPT
jgi:8-oxo-dGTP pyrophosphatase MutT (NUDIX family)